MRSRYCTSEANYWQTRTIARLLCDSTAMPTCLTNQTEDIRFGLVDSTTSDRWLEMMMMMMTTMRDWWLNCFQLQQPLTDRCVATDIYSQTYVSVVKALIWLKWTTIVKKVRSKLGNLHDSSVFAFSCEPKQHKVELRGILPSAQLDHSTKTPTV